MRGYKTVGFNILALVVAVAQYYGGSPLPEVDPGVFAGAITIINLGLRFLTTTPVFKPEPEVPKK